LRLDLSQYWEIEAFAQFGSDLDKSTLSQLERGKRLIEILKQNQYTPLRISLQIAIVYATVKGLLDEVPVNKVREFEKELHSVLNMEHSALLDQIESEKKLSDDISATLEKVIKDIQKLFVD